MMRLSNGQVILSPSDLIKFQNCRHSSALDLRYARGESLQPCEDAADAKILQRKGFEHEANYLNQVSSRSVVKIENTPDFHLAAQATISAMKSGAQVIYQGALSTGAWQGWSDFLERVEVPSHLGDYSYEVVDTKLKRSASPSHALQISIYSRAIGEIQGIFPENGHVVIGTGERISFPLIDVRYYAKRLSDRLEAFIRTPEHTDPEPVSACGQCRWRKVCDTYYDSTDSLVRVAGIRRSQREHLIAAGVTTLTQLANASPLKTRIPEETLAKLQLQAKLQLNRRTTKAPSYRLKEPEVGRGFNSLPAPSKGDLFFDMEGDPLIDGGLEYLFGVYLEPTTDGIFKAWWAHDREAEKKAVTQLLQFFINQITQHPTAHIYHYNHYEVTALKRLTQRYGVAEEQLDFLLRNKKFIDLYRVVQQGIVTSEKGYSLKDLEVFYMPKRDGDVATAADSIVAYENWMLTKDQKILDDIEHYNEVDCRSTKGLRDWLISIRPHSAQWRETDQNVTSEVIVEDDRLSMRELIDRAKIEYGDILPELLFELNAFHRRADKPQWWEYFDRQELEVDELIDDLESLGGLIAIEPANGLERLYRYPAQETKLRPKSKVIARSMKGGVTIIDIDRTKRRIKLKFAKSFGSPPNDLDLVPAGPIKNTVLRDAVYRVTEGLLTGEGRYSAISDFLNRQPPRLRNRPPGSEILTGSNDISETLQAVSAMDNTCLPIQGPPGTGKTYVSALTIIDLIQNGKRVGVASNAHKAIDNLLIAVAAQARNQGLSFTIVKKISSSEDAPRDPDIISTTSNDDRLLHDAPLVGGTAWLFARPEMDSQFDYMFIDEAGQVSIANLVAIGSAAKNIVLVGDQMQLPQPVQGVHPGESGLSTLDYLLNNERTVRPDQGIFLPISRRMHPSICKIVSDLVYESRLTSDPDTARHHIASKGDLLSSGICFIEVEHHGNGQTSQEEAERISQLYNSLLGSIFTDRKGQNHVMSIEDILVVSPYNAQVNLLTEKLPKNARVGTVDRFQGQEAPACLISMATSSAEEMPRDIEFLFSLNRLNVALSRAQALAIVVASPRLLDVPCSTLDEMRLVNALCAVSAYSSSFSASSGKSAGA
jgi:predicted RecB family nuclease